MLIFASDKYELLTPLALGIVVFAVGFGPYAGNVSRYGDVSYGLYIYHSPIIQLLVFLGVFAFNPSLGLLMAMIFAVTLAWLSWTLVEKRFLKRSSHFVVEAVATP